RRNVGPPVVGWKRAGLLAVRIRDFLPALLLALLGGALHDALALAAVLAGACVIGTRTGTRALAGVDARAIDVAARLRLLGARVDGTRKHQTRGGGRDQKSRDL